MRSNNANLVQSKNKLAAFGGFMDFSLFPNVPQPKLTQKSPRNESSLQLNLPGEFLPLMI